MKRLAILLLVLGILASCTVSDTLPVNNSQTPPVISVPQEPVVSEPEPVTPSLPQPIVSVELGELVSVGASLTRYSGRTVVNALYVEVAPISTESAVWYSTLYANGTYVYNESVMCNKIASIISSRDKFYGYNGTHICFSPVQDIQRATAFTVRVTHEGVTREQKTQTPTDLWGDYILLK